MQGFDKTSSIQQLQEELHLQANSPILQTAPQIWDSYVDKAGVFPRLQFLYTKRQLLDTLLARVAENVNFDEIGVKQDDSDITEHWMGLRTVTHDEIVRLEEVARSNRAPAVGQITQVRPETPLTGRPDPGNPFYAGVPGTCRWPFGK